MKSTNLIDEFPLEYRINIVNAIRDDAIGTIAKTDRMILTVGCRIYDKTKRKMDKVQRHVRSEMRRLAHLYHAFKPQKRKK